MQTPFHVAVIMDGNGRWATKRFLPRTAGHKKGAEVAKKIVEQAPSLGITHLTLYAFSSENWRRSPGEIQDLMDLLRYYLTKDLLELQEKNVCIRIIGNKCTLEPDIQQQIHTCEEKTANNTGLHLTIALSYGSRQEIVQAVHSLLNDPLLRDNPATITEEVLEKYLYTSGIPEPDLLIRTGGEQRLSNFLLWQMAYTELFFTPVLWPDFNEQELSQAIHTFKQRERRFGTVSLNHS